MSKKRISASVWIGTIVVVSTAVLAILYGQGQLNLGALGGLPTPIKKVARVASADCPKDALKEDNFCVFTLQPLEYYIIKEGTSFVLYGPIVEKIFKDNAWKINDGGSLNGRAYSIVKGGFTPMTLSFKLRDKKGEKVPSFVFDYPTAENIAGSRYVEVEVQNSIKIRFDTFNLPDKKLIHR